MINNRKKYNLLIPMAGTGQKFTAEGYYLPKPLIFVNDRHLVQHSMDSIVTDDCNIIFCVRQDHINDFAIDEILKEKFGQDTTIISIDHPTAGSVETCLAAKQYINNTVPLIIYTLDVNFKPIFDPNSLDFSHFSGIVLSFKANNPSHSYIRKNGNGEVIEIAEKKVISNEALVGVYCFKQGSYFVNAAEYAIENKLHTDNKYYIAPLYNLLIKNDFLIKTIEIEKINLFGNPEELNFYLKYSLRKPGDKPIALCSDHSGFEMKNFAKKHLTTIGIKCLDFGTYTPKDCDYYEYVSSAVNYISKNNAFGIGFCRTGQGVNITANKHKDVISTLVHDTYTAEHAIRHNCANFFAIPTKYVDENMFVAIIEECLSNTFDGGRHANRLMKILNT